MKIYKILLSIVLVFMATGCSAQVCQISDREIIEALFKNNEISNYFHFEIRNRKQIYIVENKVFSLDEILFKIKDITVFSASKNSLKDENYIEFKRLENKDYGIEFALYYKIENVEIRGLLICRNQKWIISNVNVLEL